MTNKTNNPNNILINSNIDDFVELFIAVNSYHSKTTYINSSRLYKASISNNCFKILDYITLIYFACRSDIYNKGLYELDIISNKDNIWMALIGDIYSSYPVKNSIVASFEKFKQTYNKEVLYNEKDQLTEIPLGKELTETILSKYNPKLVSDMDKIYDMYTTLSYKNNHDLFKLKLRDELVIVKNKVPKIKVKS